MPPRLPAFRTTCVIIGALEIVLAASILARGAEASLAPFGVPAEILGAPHFHDAILWVYVHMTMIGVVIVALGWLVTEPRMQCWCTRLLATIHAVYFVLDARTAEWALGNGLYRGPGSVVPALLCAAFTLAFATVGLRRPRGATSW